MTALTCKQVFECSPATLWPFLNDADKLKQWMHGVEYKRDISGKGVGATYVMGIKEGRKVAEYQCVVTAFEPEKRLALRMTGGCGRTPMTMSIDYRLTDLGGRTEVDYSCEFDTSKLPFFFRLLAPLMRLMGRAFVRKFFRSLQKLVAQPVARGAKA